MVQGKNFLFVTTDVNIGFMIADVKAEGNNVRLYSRECGSEILQGFFRPEEYVDDWENHAGWADIIVFDDVGWGAKADRLRREGKAVVGCSQYSDRLEMDREFGQKELKRKGLNVLREWQFKSPKDTVDFISGNPGRYVLKPCGIHDMDTTLVGADDEGADLIEIIGHMGDYWVDEGVDKFFLQEFVNGVEVEPGATFNGEAFQHPTDLTFEHKRFFTGDLGPMTWEMGSLMMYAEKNPLFDATLEKFSQDFRRAGYVGDVGLNCIVNEQGIFPLEFTCRFGFPATQIIWADEAGSKADYIWNLGHMLENEPAEPGYYVGVTCVVPPFPFNDLREQEKYYGLPITFRDEKREGVFFVDVMRKGKKYHVASSCPMVVAAKAKTVDEARAKAYSRIKNIVLENMYYRTDIASKWEAQSGLLSEWGYL
jgi:phosphoribosylamine---glycine ligase